MKTLNEIQKEPILIKRGCEGADYIKDFVGISELKQEAIAWVKEINTNSHEYNSPINKLIGGCVACSEGVGICNSTSVISWIKHFFNISEDDLK